MTRGASCDTHGSGNGNIITINVKIILLHFNLEIEHKIVKLKNHQYLAQTHNAIETGFVTAKLKIC